jgi:hypothetical protein
MSDDFELPEDDAEFAAWIDNFADKLPQYAGELGISPEQLKQIQANRSKVLRSRERMVDLEWAELTRRLNQFCPREEWPAVYADAAERLIVTPEPVRGRWLELLQDWFEGIRRVQGRLIQPKVSVSPHPVGLMIEYPYPEPVDMLRLYIRFAGEAGWNWRCSTAPQKYVLHLLADAETDEDVAAEKRASYGKMLELVVVAQSDERPIGFPSDIVRVQVPERFEPAPQRGSH